MIYVMSDIHGAYDKFIKMLELIKFNTNDILYVLGDCVDRGPDGIKILQHIMRIPNIQLLWGNHEKLMMDYLDNSTGVNLLSWFRNGGSVTCESFALLPKIERDSLCAFIESLPYFKIVDNYILCHAGIRVSDDVSFEDLTTFLSSQDINDLLWIREDFYNNKAIEGYTVIFGHTPVTYIDDTCYDEDEQICSWHDKIYKDKICIDCLAHKPYGRLCCLRLDDLREFYV
jgi:serine/threonine protein phosphatase 1